MKKIIALGVLCMSMLILRAQPKIPGLVLSNNYPQALHSLRFELRKRRPSAKKESARLLVFEMSGDKMRSLNPAEKVHSNTLGYHIVPAKNAALLLFCLKEKGRCSQYYFLPVYGKNKKPVPAYYAVFERLIAAKEEYLFDPEKDLLNFYLLRH